MSKDVVQVNRLNWDVAYHVDMLTNNGFVISEPATFNIDESKQKSLYGARSPLYGTSYEDETAFIERHRCECGAIKGRLFEGELCPVCGKPIQAKDVDIGFTGWIYLGKGNYIINPYSYNHLADCIGKTAFTDMLTSKPIVDKDGNSRLARPDEIECKSKHPFIGIGITGFRERYYEILDYFKSKKKSKESEFENLKKNACTVFTTHIPVYSTFLRPQSSTADTYYYNSIDKQINPLFTLSEKIKNCEHIDKHMVLGRIQHRVNKLWDENFNLINGKEGWIRGQILGGSLNYTSRNVIIPDPTLGANKVSVSYHAFLETYKEKIIYYLSKMDNGSLPKAYYEWYNARHRFNNRVYEIMCFINKKEHCKLILNRNPTLNYYSILLMGLHEIKRDMDDYTLSIPPEILAGLNADFDGDILNSISIVADEFAYAFRNYDPRERMMMSRDSGLLNDYVAPDKSYAIDLYNYCTC